MEPIDAQTLADLFAGPGMDTRQWISFGLVAEDSPTQPSVMFRDSLGAKLPFPIVIVTLQPSGTTVVCRVGCETAGAGESSWRPFVAGDEVLVAVPEGSENAGCTIVRRLNQELDAFPDFVAGQDTSKNAFAFDRFIPPYILEGANDILIRQVVNPATGVGSFLAFKQGNGSVTLCSADKHNLHLGPDMVGLQLGDATASVQLNASDHEVLIVSNDSVLSDGLPNPNPNETQLLISPTNTHLFSTVGIDIAGAGSKAMGHAMTVEQFLAILSVLIIPPTGLSGPTMLAAITAALGVVAASGGPLDASVTTALLGALASAKGEPGFYGVGCAGVRLG